jgi:hypothetical protein
MCPGAGKAHKKKPAGQGGLFYQRQLAFNDFDGLGAFFGLGNFEFDFLILCKRAETIALYLLVVNKEVFATVVRSDETVTFLVVKPLYFTFWHCLNFSFTSVLTTVHEYHAPVDIIAHFPQKGKHYFFISALPRSTVDKIWKET